MKVFEGKAVCKCGSSSVVTYEIIKDEFETNVCRTCAAMWNTEVKSVGQETSKFDTVADAH